MPYFVLYRKNLMKKKGKSTGGIQRLVRGNPKNID